MGVMDLTDKKSLTEDDTMSEKINKFCSDCKTSKTPLWRGGPAGPKSLCNACGIKYRKKRRAILGLNKSSENKKVRSHSTSSSLSSSSPSSTITTNSNAADDGDVKLSGRFSGLNESVKIRLFALGSEVLSQKSSSLAWVVKKQRCQRRRNLRQEELAAFSLMALSYGLVFA